jgi:hypothetical protein
VLFESDRTLRVGQEVDLSIAWPALLRKSVGLTLRIQGSIVRAEQKLTELTIKHYEFRTRRRE